jgi:hypothetical protein
MEFKFDEDELMLLVMGLTSIEPIFCTSIPVAQGDTAAKKYDVLHNKMHALLCKINEGVSSEYLDEFSKVFLDG